MKPSNPGRRFRPRHVLGLLAIAGALGVIAMMNRPASARRAAIVGRPQAVALRLPPGQLRFPPGPNASAPVVVAPSRLAPEVSGPTDRCVIEAPQVDERFSVTAPPMDERFVVKPLVQGLPVSSRATR